MHSADPGLFAFPGHMPANVPHAREELGTDKAECQVPWLENLVTDRHEATCTWAAGQGQLLCQLLNTLHFLPLYCCLPHTVLTRAALLHQTLHSMLWKSRLIEWQSHSSFHLPYYKAPFMSWPSPLCPSQRLATPRPKRAHRGASVPFQRYSEASASPEQLVFWEFLVGIREGNASIARLPGQSAAPPQTLCHKRACTVSAFLIQGQISHTPPGSHRIQLLWLTLFPKGSNIRTGAFLHKLQKCEPARFGPLPASRLNTT